MCLEEMCGRAVERGAIFHAKSKRRRELAIDAAIRARLVQVVESIRAMLSTNKLPPPVNDARCTECSMREICQPEVLARLGREHGLLTRLFDPEA
jgi:CRISPR-associated exonuclease Cas4